MKEAEKAAAAKVKEDAKIAKEIAKTAKKVTQMMMVGHGGATLVEPAITTAFQQHHESPDKATPWV